MSSAWSAMAFLGLGLACQPRAAIGPAREASTARLVLDVREPEAFAAGHAPGALNLQLGWKQLELRLSAYVPERETPLAVRAASQADAERAAGVLFELGYRDFALAPAVPELERTALMSASELTRRLDAREALVVLDIRSPEEFARGTIPGALLIDEDEGPAAVAELERDAHYAIVCEGGYRSSQLASWMAREGFHHCTNVIDGMAGWRKLGR